MKKLIYILVVLVMGKFANAQTFTVGSTCCNYHLVNKTFSLNTSYPFNCSAVDTWKLDMDGDLFADITVTSAKNIKCSASSPDIKVLAITTNNNVESAVANGTITGISYIQNLNFASSFNSILNWDTLPFALSGSSSAPLAFNMPVIYEYFSNLWITNFETGQQINPFYIALRKILPTNDTIYGWIKMDTNFPGKVIDYAYTCISYTGTPVASTITTSPAIIQKCDSILLSATPPGGIFYGQGVSGNYFSTKNLAAGIYTVNYTIPNLTGCATLHSSVIFTVNSAAITNTQTSICVGESFSLTASPTGGTYSGVGVTGNVFSPATTGTFNVKYDYTINATCSQTTSVTFTVDACVGITEAEKLNSSILVYPNPAASKLFVEMENELSSEIVLNLMNVDGRKVKSLRLTNKKQEIDLSEISSGIYFVEMVMDKHVLRKKIIITR